MGDLTAAERRLLDHYVSEMEDTEWLSLASVPDRADLVQIAIDEWGLVTEDAALLAQEATVVWLRLRDILGCTEHVVPHVGCCCAMDAPAGAPGAAPYWEVRLDP